ncbi:DUF3631 domain-containing protein [Streptomyces sp. NPDC051243]|uniref:DUF3631 domain-containing protein n=1 Tax=Streptomyces sp. NPDC051243 TaxID=3365646 RepID=UPI0037B24BC3
MTIPFPAGLDDLTAAIAGLEIPQANPPPPGDPGDYRRVQQLDEQVLAVTRGESASCLADTHEQLERLTDLLGVRMLAGAQLSRLLSTECCCRAADDGEEENAEDAEGAPDGRSCPATVHTIVHACLDVFAADGDPDAMSSADLTHRLRQLPGMAEDRWSYAELTPQRLSQLLARYGVRPRNVRFGSRQLKGYLRSSLQAALPDCSC